MSSISSVSSTGNTAMMQGMHGMRRPDPAKMAENLFDQLDTGSQGYLQKADFESAFDSISSGSGSSDVDALFTQLDGDSDGKVTKQEFTSAVTQLSEQLDQQFQSGRMQEAMQMGGMGGMGGMPPPPPPNDEGFTQDELSSQLEEIGSTDSDSEAKVMMQIMQLMHAYMTDNEARQSSLSVTA